MLLKRGSLRGGGGKRRIHLTPQPRDLGARSLELLLVGAREDLRASARMAMGEGGTCTVVKTLPQAHD